MHRRPIAIMLASLVLATTAAVAAAAEDDPVPAGAKDNPITGNIGIGLGVKILDTDWEPLGDQTVFSVSLTLGKKKWPIYLALDYVSGEAEETTTFGGFFFCCFVTRVDAKSETTEWDVGVRRVWRQEKKFRPYVGGGIAFIDGQIKVPAAGISASDSTTGYWLNTGFLQPLRNRSDWGIDLRYSKGKIDLPNGEVDAGGPQALFYVGYRW